MNLEIKLARRMLWIEWGRWTARRYYYINIKWPPTIRHGRYCAVPSEFD